ncbi:MAG TPA: Hsp20/alpha crystallin family protein [Bacteroidia bacterium]|nr:Hsp20/alpha crystallin family protein [Bacteroidia bacterium]
MTLIKFQNPKTKRFFETDAMFPGFGNAFENFLKMDYNYGESTPSVNVTENENEYHLEYLVPGFKKEEIKVALEQNVLTVKAERKTEQIDEQKRYTRKEFSFSSFKRSFTLPENIDIEKMSARHEHGILNIVLPKKVEEKKATTKEIEIL